MSERALPRSNEHEKNSEMNDSLHSHCVTDVETDALCD